MSEETPRERMERAVRAVRREGQKAALVSATVEAVAALLLVDLTVAVVPVGGVPEQVALPVALHPALASVDTGPLAALVAGVVVFGAGLWLRLRRPAVERFGEVNPEVAEALRTARDAVEDGAESRMASRLYEETVERLAETSSLGLLEVRRVAVALVLVAVLAPASIGATATGVELAVGGADGPTVPGSEAPDEYEGLQDPNSVLGDPDDVEAGSEELNATVESSGGGGNASRAASGAYDSGFAGAGSAETETQQAGFAEQERLEDAELIREYNLRIRQDEDDTQ